MNTLRSMCPRELQHNSNSLCGITTSQTNPTSWVLPTSISSLWILSTHQRPSTSLMANREAYASDSCSDPAMSSDHDRAHPLLATLSRLLLVVSSPVLPERRSRVVLQLRELLATALVGELRSSAAASLTKR